MSETEKIIAFKGEVWLAGWDESHNGGRTVKFQLSEGPDDPIEHPMKQFTVKRGKRAGTRFMMVLVEIGDDELPVEQPGPIAEQAPIKEAPAQVAKPFGQYASRLYAENFFRNVRVLQAIGTDASFLEWLKTRRCCVARQGGCHGDIVAAHVRRIANGAGTGIKPSYSALPMCDQHHKLQHQHGESAVGGKEALDDKRWYYLVEWAKTRLAACFGQSSMGYVRPNDLVDWAHANGVMDLLPECYQVLSYALDD